MKYLLNVSTKKHFRLLSELYSLLFQIIVSMIMKDYISFRLLLELYSLLYMRKIILYLLHLKIYVSYQSYILSYAKKYEKNWEGVGLGFRLLLELYSLLYMRKIILYLLHLKIYVSYQSYILSYK